MNASLNVENILALENEPITRLVQLWQNGNKSSYDELFSLCYAHIKNQVRIQKKRLNSNNSLDHCIQATTCLAHEAYLKLSSHREQSIEQRKDLYSLIAQVIKTVIFDQYRKATAIKRSPDSDFHANSNSDSGEFIDIPEMEFVIDLAAIDKSLSLEKERSSIVFNFNVFGGLSPDNISELLGISLRTVHNDLSFAKAWYSKHLGKT